MLSTLVQIFSIWIPILLSSWKKSLKINLNNSNIDQRQEWNEQNIKSTYEVIKNSYHFVVNFEIFDFWPYRYNFPSYISCCSNKRPPQPKQIIINNGVLKKKKSSSLILIVYTINWKSNKAPKENLHGDAINKPNRKTQYISDKR